MVYPYLSPGLKPKSLLGRLSHWLKPALPLLKEEASTFFDYCNSGTCVRNSPWELKEPKREFEGGINMSKEPSGAEKMFGNFAPKLVQLTDDVLFGDVWERKELSKRDRSLITVAALIALNRPDQLRFHLGRAVENGVQEQELIEVITHLAFYSGWPNAMTAMTVAKDLFSKT
jgi:4-carboxymuconolactone decarboxylase